MSTPSIPRPYSSFRQTHTDRVIFGVSTVGLAVSVIGACDHLFDLRHFCLAESVHFRDFNERKASTADHAKR
jgi:hypothetical protein